MSRKKSKLTQDQVDKVVTKILNEGLEAESNFVDFTVMRSIVESDIDKLDDKQLEMLFFNSLLLLSNKISKPPEKYKKFLKKYQSFIVETISRDQNQEKYTKIKEKIEVEALESQELNRKLENLSEQEKKAQESAVNFEELSKRFAALESGSVSEPKNSAETSEIQPPVEQPKPDEPSKPGLIYTEVSELELQRAAALASQDSKVSQDLKPTESLRTTRSVTTSPAPLRFTPARDVYAKRQRSSTGHLVRPSAVRQTDPEDKTLAEIKAKLMETVSKSRTQKPDEKPIVVDMTDDGKISINEKIASGATQEICTVHKNTDNSIEYQFSNPLTQGVAEVILEASRGSVLTLSSENFKDIKTILEAAKASEQDGSNQKIIELDDRTRDFLTQTLENPSNSLEAQDKEWIRAALQDQRRERLQPGGPL